MNRLRMSVIALLMVSAVSVSFADTAEEQMVLLKQENAELHDELARVTTAYDRLEAETGRLRAELAALQLNNEDLTVQTRELTELAGLTPTGDRVESASARFTSAYDEETGRTTVRSGIEELKVIRGSAADHRLSLAYSFEGENMQQPPEVVTMFIQAKFSGGVYREQEHALFDIDGEEVVVAISDYDMVSRKVRVAGKRTLRKDDETLKIDIDAELLRKLARAIQVKITVGTVELEPTRDQTAMFRAVRKRIDLGA